MDVCSTAGEEFDDVIGINEAKQFDVDLFVMNACIAFELVEDFLPSSHLPNKINTSLLEQSGSFEDKPISLEFACTADGDKLHSPFLWLPML